jgi:hypothetical protein
MKMLTLVCGEKIEEEIVVLLAEFDVKGYTILSQVAGSGKTGMVSGTGGWTDRNKLYLIGLDDAHMARLLTGVRELHGKFLDARHGHEVPLKAFVQTCELVV